MTKWAGRTSLVGGLLLLSFLGGGSVQAEFIPSLSLNAAYIDNVNYVGNLENASAYEARLSANLPWYWQSKRTEYHFSYSPMAVANSDFSDLDRLEHRLRFSSTTQAGRPSHFRSEVNLAKTQAQGDPRSLDDSDLILDDRTDRTLGRVELTYSRRTSQRWRAYGIASAAFSEYKPLDDSDSEETIDDKRYEYQLAGGFGHDLSQKSEIGARLGVRKYDLNTTGDETVADVNATWDYDVAEQLQVKLVAGVYHRKQDKSGDTPDAQGGTQTGMNLRFNLERQYRAMILAFNVSHSPSAGGSLGGTSTNTTVQLNLSSPSVNVWDWETAIRYAHRDPTAATSATVQNVSLGGRVEREVSRYFGIDLGLLAVNQESDNEFEDTTYWTAALGLVWHPAGRRKGRRN